MAGLLLLLCWDDQTPEQFHGCVAADDIAI